MGGFLGVDREFSKRGSDPGICGVQAKSPGMRMVDDFPPEAEACVISVQF